MSQPLIFTNNEYGPHEEQWYEDNPNNPWSGSGSGGGGGGSSFDWQGLAGSVFNNLGGIIYAIKGDKPQVAGTNPTHEPKPDNTKLWLYGAGALVLVGLIVYFAFIRK